MKNAYTTNKSLLVAKISRFISFVRYMDNNNPGISFRDSSGFLGREEDYKSRIAEEARKELKYDKWSVSWIGTGKIAECAKAAMSKAGNLVNKNQQIDFKNRLDPKNDKYEMDAEQVLYNIYCDSSYVSSKAFAEAIEVFGAKYDTIAFLFFIKDDTKYLPISVGHFDKGFNELGIDYTTSFNCSWENYIGFINIIEEIQDILEDMIPMQGKPRLIDAHSFVWIIQQDRFINWIPNVEESLKIEYLAEEYVQKDIVGKGGRKKVTSETYIRSSEVVKETRIRARGVCQYCDQPAPFNDKKGNPYLEVHHVVWLSRGGEDSTENTVALCPNCHKMMHVLDRSEDIEKLKMIAMGR